MHIHTYVHIVKFVQNLLTKIVTCMHIKLVYTYACLSELKMLKCFWLFSDPFHHMTQFGRTNLLYTSNEEANDSI